MRYEELVPPEALSTLLRVSGRELLDRARALDELSSPIDPTLADELADAGDPASRLERLRRHLARAAAGIACDRRMGAAVNLALADGRALSAGSSAPSGHWRIRDAAGSHRSRRGPALRSGPHGAGFSIVRGIAPARYLREMRELTRNFIPDLAPAENRYHFASSHMADSSKSPPDGTS